MNLADQLIHNAKCTRPTPPTQAFRDRLARALRHEWDLHAIYPWGAVLDFRDGSTDALMICLENSGEIYTVRPHYPLTGDRRRSWTWTRE